MCIVILVVYTYLPLPSIYIAEPVVAFVRRGRPETCTIRVPTAGRQDPVFVNETEEETPLLFTDDCTVTPTTFEIERSNGFERIFLKFDGRYVNERRNEDGSCILVLATRGTRPEQAFLTFQRT